MGGYSWDKIGTKSLAHKKQRLYKIVKSRKTVVIFNGAEGGNRILSGPG